MKKILIVIILLFSSYYNVSAQTANKTKIAREIEHITDVPYIPELSGDSSYWNLVVQGKSIIPALISNLTNTTKTNISIPNWGGEYCYGDIAFSILEHIIVGIPIEDFIQKK